MDTPFTPMTWYWLSLGHQDYLVRLETSGETCMVLIPNPSSRSCQLKSVNIYHVLGLIAQGAEHVEAKPGVALWADAQVKA